ncbi:NERD nuclease [Peribacillus asahii]|uniref:NERD nuclease n=1 Tax=Peribacillus asahii TaxID=228899 RepID=A0A3Q9RLQ4_9BACI|nr:nuclease-related domain-containing protein [Peribacillus asahii]AZV42014.1 NERD nuclease [Peribacillus asahii]
MLSKILKNFLKENSTEQVSVASNNEIIKKKSNITPARIGELGEYKINIQLDQLPNNIKYLSDVLIPNTHAKSGYSQIDHVIFTPYAIFVVETKNYTGTIYGDRSRAKWSINGKFPMMNPFNQNYGHIQALQSVLKTVEMSQFVSMVSFTKRCTFKVNEELRKIQSNDLIVYDTELSEYITRKLNVLKLQKQSLTFSDDDILHMYNALEKNNITDEGIRKKHVELLKGKINIETSNGGQTKVATCRICGKVVSEKVKFFCLSNKEQFKGNIYCYEHQKLHR